jgi:hypothetical protein
MIVSIFMFSCGDYVYIPIVYNSFASELQGTWVSNDASIYSGTLVITFDTITITGFNEGQTQLGDGDDNKRPFRGFTRGIPLKGYSEEGRIFIEDIGMLQNSIPYEYYTAGVSQQGRFLRFIFGGRTETMGMVTTP